MKMLKGNNIILIVVLAVFSVTLWGCAGNLPEAKGRDSGHELGEIF